MKQYIKKFLNQFINIQFFKFGIVGLFNTIIAQSSTYAIILIFNISNENFFFILSSSFFGNAVGILNSFYWNNKYVFKKINRKKTLTFVKTFICYTTTWLISMVLTYIYSSILNINKLLVPILSMIITVPLNFIINKFWAFK